MSTPRFSIFTGRVRNVAASAQALGLAEDVFEAETMTMVLHRVDAIRALCEAVRVQSPGGVLLILGIGRFGGWR